MPTDLHSDSPFERLALALDELKLALPAALEGRQQGATKQDLREMEARLVVAIASHHPTEGDLRELQKLLARSRRIAAKLTALDAQTTPK